MRRDIGAARTRSRWWPPFVPNNATRDTAGPAAKRRGARHVAHERALQASTGGRIDGGGMFASRRRRAETRSLFRFQSRRRVNTLDAGGRRTPTRGPRSWPPARGWRVGEPVGEHEGLVLGEIPVVGHEQEFAPVLQSLSRDIRPGCPDTSQSADERTRTSTDLHPHGPEPCASTNSATSACRVSEHSAPALAGSAPPALAALRARRREPKSARIALLASGGHCAPLSSRGLGRRPLMAETRVRIPVAVLELAPENYGRFRRSGRVRASARASRARHAHRAASA